MKQLLRKKKKKKRNKLIIALLKIEIQFIEIQSVFNVQIWKISAWIEFWIRANQG